jgi:hypothetical protein
MPSLADQIKDIDASIYDAIGEVMLVGVVSVPGVFHKDYAEKTLADGTVIAGLAIYFHCQLNDTVAALNEGDAVTVQVGSTSTAYRFLRRYPNDGDETGRVTLELGT